MILGFKDEADEDEELMESQMAHIDTAITSLNKKTTLPLIASILLKMLQAEDWKQQYSGLLALSQMAEHVERIGDISSFMPLVFKYMKSPHSKVRYAAVHCIGQIAEDKKEDFTSLYYSTTIHLFLNGLKDSVPRVTSHILAAMSNLIEHTSAESLKQDITSIIEPCLSLLGSGIPIIKENALPAIASVAQIAEEDFIPHWHKTAETMLQILKDSDKNEDKAIRGRCIEGLTMMGLAVGKEEFEEFADQVIERMTEIQQNDITQDEPQICYILGGWKRILLILKEDFGPYLKEMSTSLFNMIDVITNKQTGTSMDSNQPNTEFADDPISTSTENLTCCVDMLHAFLQLLGQDYLPYVEKTSEVLIRIFSHSSNEKAKTDAAKAFHKTIKCIQQSDKPDKASIVAAQAKTYVKLLWDSANEEFDTESLIDFAHALKEVLSAAGRYMTQPETSHFIEDFIMKQIQNSIDRMNDYQNSSSSEEEDQSDEDINEANTNEEDLQCVLADVIGALFGSHKELVLPFAQTVQSELIPKALTVNTPASKTFAMFLAGNLIEFLGIELIPGEWQQLVKMLVEHSTDSSPDVRQAAVYGISALAEKSGEAFSQVSVSCLQALLSAVKVKKTEAEDKEYFYYARDNAVASIGKVIKSQPNNIGADKNVLISFWLTNLPLKYNKSEAREHHELLLDMILESPSLVFGEKGKNALTIFRILADAVDTDLVDEEKFEEKLEKVIEDLMSNDIMRPIFQKVIMILNDEGQEKLQRFLPLDE